MKFLPPVGFLRECFVYDPSTGELYWKKRPKKHFMNARRWRQVNTRCAGKLAGLLGSSGYLQLRLTYAGRREHLLAHRIIWKLMIGSEPPKTIDHDDGDVLNNCWTNLRSATMTEQRWNSRIYKNSLSGYRGVSLAKGGKRWQARIHVGAADQWLGTFDTVEEAAAIYEAAARKLHGEFYRDEKAR